MERVAISIYNAGIISCKCSRGVQGLSAEQTLSYSGARYRVRVESNEAEDIEQMLALVDGDSAGQVLVS
jgi:hypothetical protein